MLDGILNELKVSRLRDYCEKAWRNISGIPCIIQYDQASQQSACDSRMITLMNQFNSWEKKKVEWLHHVLQLSKVTTGIQRRVRGGNWARGERCYNPRYAPPNASYVLYRPTNTIGAHRALVVRYRGIQQA